LHILAEKINFKKKSIHLHLIPIQFKGKTTRLF
jgi:hypothetical protein